MTDKKYTDEKIVKALRCCVEVRNCGECPVKDEPVSECLIIACTNAAKIINRQKTEIEDLKVELAAMRGAANSYRAEIERLKANNKIYIEANRNWVSTRQVR